MKNTKPFLLGCMAGCGAMFVALQYHVVQSHDGLQLIPRAPQAALGLAWADVREWDAATWTDRPELARALVAHGSSDLITESVAREIVDSADPDSGTMSRLRSLLNDSMSSDLEAPLFEQDDSASLDRRRGNLAIPFPHETRNEDWGDLFSNRGRPRADLADRSGTRFDDASTGFADLDDVISEENQREFEDRFARPSERRRRSPFSQADSSWSDNRSSGDSSGTSAESRARETMLLEDLLFSEDPGPQAAIPAPLESAMLESRFESVTRALDSRASAALERARAELAESSGVIPDSSEPAGSGGVADRSQPNSQTDSIPRAVRALREGFDPFLQ